MTRLSALAIAAALSFSPVAAFAAEHACTPAQEAATKISASGLTCAQFVAQFDGTHSTETARMDRPAAPRS